MSIHQQLTSAHVPQIKVTRNQSNRPQRPFASSTYRPQLQPPISLRPTAPVRRNSANAAMLGARRASVVSPAPPMSPSSIPRPHSSTGHHSHARMPSDAASQRGSPDPESRNVRVGMSIACVAITSNTDVPPWQSSVSDLLIQTTPQYPLDSETFSSTPSLPATFV